MVWKRLNGTLLAGEIIDEVKHTILEEMSKGHKIRVCIGTDSQVTSGITEFATVIVFIRERAGGFMFIAKEKTKQKLSLKERMITEVSKSVQVAYAIQPLLNDMGIPMEVHADVNEDPSHKSNSAFQEAKGYIKGMGFEFKAKPYAFASSYCADKFI